MTPEEKRAYSREYNRRRYHTNPEYRDAVKERARAYYKGEEGKAYRREYMREYLSRPGVRERVNERRRLRYATDPDFRARRIASSRKPHKIDPRTLRPRENDTD